MLVFLVCTDCLHFASVDYNDIQWAVRYKCSPVEQGSVFRSNFTISSRQTKNIIQSESFNRSISNNKSFMVILGLFTVAILGPFSAHFQTHFRLIFVYLAGEPRGWRNVEKRPTLTFIFSEPWLTPPTIYLLNIVYFSHMYVFSEFFF